MSVTIGSQRYNIQRAECETVRREFQELNSSYLGWAVGLILAGAVITCAGGVFIGNSPYASIPLALGPITILVGALCAYQGRQTGKTLAKIDSIITALDKGSGLQEAYKSLTLAEHIQMDQYASILQQVQ